MRLTVLHQFQAHTTGNYFRKSWQHNHTVDYLSEFPTSSFKSPLQIQTFLKEKEVDLLVCIDPVGILFPINLEKTNCPTAIYLIDVHQNFEQRLRLAYLFDYVFVAQKDYLLAFKQQGITNVFWLPLACDSDFHLNSSASSVELYDVGFVGNRGAGAGQRRQILDALAENFKVNDLSRKYRLEEIGLIYSQSRMVFNWSINGDVNMRIFEALCSGRLLLTNAIPNGLEDLFIDRKHLVIYRNVEELVELIKYYLAHPEEREAIAQAGQAEVLAKHTYQHRTEQILSTIFDSGEPHLTAPIRSFSPQKRWEAYAQVLADLRQPLATLRVAHQAFERGEFTFKLGSQVIAAGLRAVNVRVPLTPNAIRHRWQALYTHFLN